MTEGSVPLPTLSEWNRPFFAAGFHGELKLQRCDQCAKLIYYPRPLCPYCLSASYHWVAMSGEGTIYSFAIVWHPQQRAFDDRVPIVLAIIQLVEGPQMVSTVIRSEPDEMHIGASVRVVFDRVTDEIALPKFVLAGTGVGADSAPPGGVS